MIGLIGKKIGMTQVFDEHGKVTPVSVIQAGPCAIIQKKTIEKEGYRGIQLGFIEMKENKVNKPQMGHFKKHGTKPYRYIKEFRIENDYVLDEGDILDVSMFQENELIKVIGTSKGKGFTGVMKRHGFRGFQSSHGVHESFRGPGSIGQCATPGRVFKGLKMAGHKGVDRVTVKNLKVVKVDLENNLLLVKGAIPGHRNSLVLLNKEL
jgi:large subunit ribosomal protein L3